VTPTAPDGQGLPPPEWNATERTYPALLLHEAFAAQAARTPEAPALRFRHETLTYAQLDARAEQLARRLRDLGAAPGALVAVCMERSFEMVVSLYAILKAGAAYVPIDPEYPAERIAFMLADTGAPIVLTQGRLAERVQGATGTVIAVDEPAGAAVADGPLPAVGPADLAYVIYTSGSTGQPKGAMISHRAIANRISWMQEAYGLTADDRVLQKTPFSFDVSVWEFFWPLLFGAQLVIAEPGGHRDTTYLARTIVEDGITTIHFVPSMLQLFLEDPRAGDCTSLRRVICSGEALPKALQDRFFGQLDAELHNLYGPTEAAVDVTAWACDRTSPLTFVPIGKPIANTQIHILDEELRRVPVGSAGELCIGGVQVGEGYLARPELTRERFVEDPFSGRPEARLYRTGDLARHLPDGNIEFLGRSDYQVKIRGFRVELGEIEAAIEAIEGVRQTVVVARERSGGDLELVAYVSHVAGDELPIEELRGRLGARLPEYIVPTLFVPLERFPLTPSGKVDRKLLPAPVRRRPHLGEPYVAPRTALERLVAEKWRDILDLDEVGVHDRFFELGGTSLQAARFVNQMQVAMGESIFIVTLFSAPSVAAYAAFLETQYPAAVARLLGSEASAAVPAIPRASSRQPIEEADVARLRAAVPGLGRVTADGGGPNPPAIFILSPPRSGTTLLRIMLAGHHDLFAASELQLLGFHTLEERAQAYSGRFSGWLDGAIRTVMGVQGLDADAAKRLIADAQAEGLTTKAFYRRLQDWVAPRVLVDKSPSYALDPAALEKAEADFEGPRYIHLVRHPLAMIDSFERHHMEQVLYLHEHPFDARQLAELVWTLSHRTTVSFLAGVPESRWFRLRYEDLVGDPPGRMEALCAQLGLPFDPGILRPYEGLEDKMVDGVYPESAPMGDPGFLAHGSIDPSLAATRDEPEGWELLGQPTRDLAASLGYGTAATVAGERRASRSSLARQREARSTGRERRHD
jgi:amino acid adenylation domain-containing protein